MPKTVSPTMRLTAIQMMLKEGSSQRDISKETGLSRPYLRKLSRQMGFQFPRNGIENISSLCVCSGCGDYFNRPKSKIDRAKRNFCSTSCKRWSSKGSENPLWKGKSKKTSFSDWIVGQKEYKDWREAVLAKYNNKCAITGSTDQLEAHHLKEKSLDKHPELMFDVDNGICISKPVHTRVHQLISQGFDAESAMNAVRAEYHSGLIKP